MLALKRISIASAIAAVLLGLLAGCGTPAGSSSTLRVVAAENFWGSIASQLGGDKASVTTILNNPNTDPHDYESSAVDARAFASADYVIINGAGYDDWAQKLLTANPNSNRKVLNVASFLGKRSGDNPHIWYNPTWVSQVADRLSADYTALDAGNADYFEQQRSRLTTAFEPYSDLVSAIKSRYAHTPVAATESIFVYLAQALDLDLVTPPEFMNAIAEGNDPPTQTIAQFQNLLAHHQVRVLVVNIQASTAITDTLKQLANQNHIPTVGISETLQPAGATFQDWQARQLEALRAALARGA